MNIQVGDKVTYKYAEGKKNEMIIINTTDLENYLYELEYDSNYKILKIERIGKDGWCTVYEYKKELLTEDEKEFLKQYVKMSKLKITNIVKENEDNQCKLVLYENGFGNCTYYKENYFKSLELNKKYTLSELGLEE